MSECKWCGRKGIFLRLSKESGLCKNCHSTVIPDVYKRTRAAQEAFDVLDKSKDLNAKIENCNLIIENAQTLINYEAKRVCNLTPHSASELLELAKKKKKKYTLEIQRQARIVKEKPICPYCNAALKKAPKRKTRCKECGNHIFVDTTQQIFPRTSLTEEETGIVGWFDTLRRFGATTEEFRKKKRELEERFGSKALPRDVLWALFVDAATKVALKNDFSSLAGIYYAQAEFLYEEGKNYLPVLRQFHELTLKNKILTQRGGDILYGVEIETDGGACPTCRKLEGIRLTIEEALKKNLLPNVDCTHKLDPKRKDHFCRCYYTDSTKTFREMGIDIDD